MAIKAGSKAPDSRSNPKKQLVWWTSSSAITSAKKTRCCCFSRGVHKRLHQGIVRHQPGLERLHRRGADVIGISIDTPFAQEAWAQKEKISVTLASDLNKEVTQKYDVVFPMLAGIGDTAARAAFVIDKSGVVQYSEQTPTPKDLPNFEAVKATLARLG